MASGSDALIPLELFRECATLKPNLFVFATIAAHSKRQRVPAPVVTIRQLAQECRMKADDVRKAIGWLIAEGWLDRATVTGGASAYTPRLTRRKVSAGTG